jgi:hypothetical protein
VGEPINRADLANAAEQLRTVLAAVPADPTMPRICEVQQTR